MPLVSFILLHIFLSISTHETNQLFQVFCLKQITIIIFLASGTPLQINLNLLYLEKGGCLWITP